MGKKKNKYWKKMEMLSTKITDWMGTPQSLLAHTAVFVGCLMLVLVGVNADKVMLILTTLVSLEAIYLSLFIQMTVNRNTASLEDVEESVENLEDDVEELSADIDLIQAEEERENLTYEVQTSQALDSIGRQLNSLTEGLVVLKNDVEKLKGKLENQENGEKLKQEWMGV